MKKYIIQFFVVLTLLLLPIQLIAQEENDYYKQVGDSLIQNKAFDVLIESFTKELKLHPNNEQILRGLGLSYFVIGKLEDGKKYYLKALKINPNCGNCYAHLAGAAIKQNDIPLAETYLNDGLKIDPVNILILTNRGKLYEVQGEKLKALNDYDLVIKLAPTMPDSYLNRGVFNLTNGYVSLALSDMNKGIALDSTNYLGYYNRSHIYYNQQNFTAAINDIDKAISLDSNNGELYMGRGAVYAALNIFDKALEDYSTAIALNPDAPTAYYNRALAYYNLENLDSSCKDLKTLESFFFKEAIDANTISEVQAKLADYCDTEKPSYYYQRGVGFYNLEKYDKAILIYKEGLTHFPENSMLHSFLGNAYLVSKSYNKALDSYKLSLLHKESYRTEIRNNPNFIAAPKERIEHFYLGALAEMYKSIAESYFYLGDFDSALKSINSAFENEHNLSFTIDFSQYYYKRALIHLAQQHYDLAFNDFENSLRLNANIAEAYTNSIIAQVSILEDIEVVSMRVGNDIDEHEFNIVWELKDAKLSNFTKAELENALVGIGIPIRNNANNGYAYYIRARIKKLLKQAYCEDVKKAINLNVKIEKDLLEKCNE